MGIALVGIIVSGNCMGVNYSRLEFSGSELSVGRVCRGGTPPQIS